jgi:beta-N-acetylglucosaminidase
VADKEINRELICLKGKMIHGLAAGVLTFTLFSGSVLAETTINTNDPVVGGTFQTDLTTNQKVEIENIQVPASTDSRFVTSVELPLYKSYEGLSDYEKHNDPELGKNGLYLEYGDTVIILEELRLGVKVKTTDGSKEGWVHKDYLSSALNQTWLVKEWRNLRQGPSTVYPQVMIDGEPAQIPDGSIVFVLDYDASTNFYKVRTDTGLEGWVYGLYIDSETNQMTNGGNNLIQYEVSKVGAVTNQVTVFTPLNTVANVTAEEINSFIASKTYGEPRLITGMGEAYIEAQNVSGLNAFYLIAHSALETGWGTSKIVNDKYNFYGIGAIDSNPYQGAYDFSSPKNGIIAGAIWINNNYVEAAYPYYQPTLDNMRNNENFHQYATDEAWAVKIASIAKEFYLYNGNKPLKTGWYSEGSKKYYFDTAGRMKTGWFDYSGKKYFFELNGYMKTSWLLSQNKWYYFNSDGTMRANAWVLYGGEWYYLGSDGVMKTGWISYGGKWYYLDKDGAMLESKWVSYKGDWYYMGADGIMDTGWLKYGGKWYFLDHSGVMFDAGWKLINNKWYYFYSSGIMAQSTIINGYRIGADGAWIR